MAFSGVRSSWLMVARKRLLEASARSASVRASSSACSWILRSVTSRITATTSASVAADASRRLFERPAAHFEPDEIGGRGRPRSPRGTSRRTRNSTLRASPPRAGIRQRGEIGRTIGDMDAIEQAVPEQPRRRRAEQRFRRRRDELHRAVAAVARDHVAHVARQQAIAVFLDARAARRWCAPATRRRRQARPHRASPRRRRTPSARRARPRSASGAGSKSKCPIAISSRGAGQRQRGGERHHAARRRQRGLERNHHQPDRGEGCDAAGGRSPPS